MPNYKGHLLGGLAIFIATILLVYTRYSISFFTGLEWGLCTLLGSLFPDIDTKSKGQKLFYRVLFIFLIFLIFQNKFQLAVFMCLAGFIPLLVNHRGLCHNILFILAIPTLFSGYVYLFLPKYTLLILGSMIFFTLGAISHLCLDKGPIRMLKAW